MRRLLIPLVLTYLRCWCVVIPLFFSCSFYHRVATKLGRTPLWVDLDPAENALSVPGTLAAAPMSRSAVSIGTYACTGIPPSTTSPLVMWYGSTSLGNPDLFKAQVSAMSDKIEKRLEGDVDARASGIIVNTNGHIQGVRQYGACVGPCR